MLTLTIGETTIPYTLRRSKVAKKARITVTPGSVEVVVPMQATDDEVAGVLHRRRGWLVEQSKAMSRQAAAAPVVVRFVTGAKIPFRGRMMRLTVEPTDEPLAEVTYRNGFLVRLPRQINESSRDNVVESALRLWLKRRLREDVNGLIRQHGERNGLRPRAVYIKDQQHMWGSCGKDRSINLNWHLIFGPKTVLEYAVVHELCHLRHRNHDPAFWSLVGTILPDWSQRKAWLDQNERLLILRRVRPG